MENLSLISNLLCVLGVIMLISSIIMYIKRTGDKTALTRFWASKAELNKAELIFNRLGLAAFVIGVLLPIVLK